MARPLAAKLLELLPPKTLAELVTYIDSNRGAVSILTKASRGTSECLPCAFWFLDEYEDEGDRIAALAAASQALASLDRQVVMYDGGANNYWQELSAAVFGSSQDKEFRDSLGDLGVEKGFKADATALADVLDAATIKKLQSSDSFRRASKATQTAIVSNLDYLIQLKKYGQAIQQMQKRFHERMRYAGHYGVDILPPAGFTGDTQSSHLAATEMKGDIVNAFARSTDPRFTGGLGSFFKKTFKAIGKVVKPLASFIPGVGPIIGALVNRPASSPPYDSPAQSPSAAMLAPMIGPGNLPSTSDFVTHNDDRTKVLMTLANMAIAKAGGRVMSGDPFVGDLLSPSAAVNYVNLPMISTGEPGIQSPTGRVYFAGDIIEEAANTGRTVGDVVRAKDGTPITCAEICARLAPHSEELRALGMSGDPETDAVAITDAYFDSQQYRGAPDEPDGFWAGLQKGVVTIGKDLASDALDKLLNPGRSQSTKPATEPSLTQKAADILAKSFGIISPVSGGLLKSVVQSADAFFSSVRNAFLAKREGAKPMFSPASRFLELGRAGSDQIQGYQNNPPPASGLNS